GLPVPKAHAISVRAAEEHFERALGDASKPEELLTSGDYDEATLAEIREKVRAAPLDPALVREIERAVAALLAEGGRLAVRSSASLEDTDDFSAAGLHETVLGLRTAE